MIDDPFSVSQEHAERRKFSLFCALKTNGMQAFVASSNARDRRLRSVVLVGSRADGWRQAVVCQGGDHYERARGYADEYNAMDVL